MSKILMLKPVFQERIWGGNNLSKKYGYRLDSDKIGECWAISAHPNGCCSILDGKYKDMLLSDVFKSNKHLFNNSKDDEFPLLVKFLDANNDLSVQVHPNDEYAKKHCNCLGKTESWYVLDCKKDSKIVYGHNAKTLEEFKYLIQNSMWGKLLRLQDIKIGDFLYVPSGKIHAVKAGTIVYEVQQSSDITYRVYDYDRVDKNNQKRELHINESIETTLVPDEYIENKIITTNVDGNIINLLTKSKYFSVENWKIKNKYERKNPGYLLVTVLEGSGIICDRNVKKGDNLIITSLVENAVFEGLFEVMISYV